MVASDNVQKLDFLLSLIQVVQFLTWKKAIKKLKYHTLPQCTTLSDHLSTRNKAQPKHQNENFNYFKGN